MIITVLRYILLYIVIILGSIFIKYKTDKKLSNSVPVYILTNMVIL